MILATLCLSLPVILKGFLNVFRGAFHYFEDETTFIGVSVSVNIMFYLTGIIVPIGTQLLSLIFGHIKKTKSEKYKLKTRVLSHNDESFETEEDED